MKLFGKQKTGLPKVGWSPLQTVLVFAVAWLVVPIVGLSVLTVIGQWVPAVANWVNLLSKGDPIASFNYIVVEAIVAVGSTYAVARKYGQGWRELGWLPVNIFKAIVYIIVWLLIVAIVIAIITSIIAMLVPAFNANQEQVNEFTKPSNSGNIKLISLFALVIIPPFIEETVFRGFIFPAFAGRFGVVWGAIISSALFGAAHLQWNVSIYTVILGLILCRLYYKFGSIVPGIGLHMLNNYLAFYALYHK